MNKQWLLARTPTEALPTDGDFTLVESPIPEPGPNQMLTRTIYLSLDPYQWGRRRGGCGCSVFEDVLPRSHPHEHHVTALHG